MNAYIKLKSQGKLNYFLNIKRMLIKLPYNIIIIMIVMFLFNIFSNGKPIFIEII